MADLTNPNNLLQVLRMLSAPETETIKKAEKLLKPFLKQPTSAVHLVNVLGGCPELACRHHAALLLKKKIAKFYTHYNSQQQSELRAGLIQLLINEQDSNVATAIAGVVGATAKAAFAAKQQWPEVFNLLTQLSQDPNERLRILSFKLLTELSEYISDELKPHSQTLAHMFSVGCQDAVTGVVIEALSATGTYIMQLGDSPEVMAMKNVIPPMLGAMGKCLRDGDEDIVVEGLDVMQQCCELEQPLINDHIEEIVHFAVHIIQAQEVDNSVKQSAGQTLMNIVEFRPKLFAKKNMVGPVLTMLMDMIAKQDANSAGSLFSFTNPLDEDGADSDYDEDEEDFNKLAQILIDTMAIHIPSKYFCDIALAMISQGITSPDPNMRKAGCAVLGVIAEGCSDKIRENLAGILPILLKSVQDSEYYVRECACFALGQFSEYCQPEILQYNQMVLPVIFNALDDARPTVQGTSCYVLEYFCENLQPETLRPFLPPLMGKLANLLQSDQKTTKEMALSAIAATAVASEIDFLPYTETVCGILHNYLFLTEPTSFTLRGRSLECLGHIAIAVGKEHFLRYFEMGMRSATDGLKLDDENLKEHCFVYVANSVKVMGKDFKNFLNDLVPYLLDVVEESEIMKFEDEDEEEGEDEADGEEDEELGDYRLNVMEGFVNSKKAALTALGAIAEHTQELFYGFLKRSLDAVVTQDIGSLFSLHDNIRSESITILQYFLMSACTFHGMAVPQKGVNQVLPPEVQELTRIIMNVCVTALVADEDKMPVSYACECIDGVLKLVGVAALHVPSTSSNNPVAVDLIKAIHTLLNEKAPCQTARKVEKGDDEEEEDHDNGVIDSVTDLVASLARVLGADFVPYFDEFHRILLKFTKPTRSHSDRAMAIGCYGEVVKELGAVSIKYAESLLSIIHAGLSDPMESVRRNSAFCVGVLIESTGTALAPHFLNILQWLHPLCIRNENQLGSDAGGADVDNALAAVTRMINAAPASVPLGHVLPVVLSALPLRSDTTEGPTVYGCFVTLLLGNNADAINNVGKLVALFCETLAPNSTAIDETKAISVQGLKSLLQHPQLAAAVQNHLGTMTDPEHQRIISAALQ